jgi:hypothetical protein
MSKNQKGKKLLEKIVTEKYNILKLFLRNERNIAI